jgi:hypothetical protein
MNQVMMGLTWSIVGVLKDRSESGSAIASNFDRSIGNLVELDQCFYYDNDGKNTTYFSSIGILIFGVPWCDVCADDALVAACSL